MHKNKAHPTRFLSLGISKENKLNTINMNISQSESIKRRWKELQKKSGAPKPFGTPKPGAPKPGAPKPEEPKKPW